jgi:hypothetical protein
MKFVPTKYRREWLNIYISEEKKIISEIIHSNEGARSLASIIAKYICAPKKVIKHTQWV